MSTRRRYRNLECVVLRSINYKDSDRIYSLISKDKGKITASAPGVRKISSRRSGNLDTLNHIVVGVSSSKDGFNIITEVQTKNSFKSLKQGLKNSVKGFYVAELVYKFLGEEQESREVFDLLVLTLKRLNGKKDESTEVVNEFEVGLMGLLGYGMYLDKCAKCGRKFSDEWKFVKFNPSYGGFICDRCDLAGGRISMEAARILNSYKTKSSVDIEDRYVKEADVLIKMFVKGILEDITGTERVFGEI